MPTEQDIERYRQNWQDEIDSAARYRAMADSEDRSGTATVYRDLADMEEKHAAFWERRLADAGAPAGPRRIGWRTRVLVWLARRFGAGLVLPTIAAGEHRDRNDYLAQAETRGTRMAAQERNHARILGLLVSRTSGIEGGVLAQIEGRHRNVGGNALRAAVLGANDGLCSNLSLVMGVAGAAPSGHAVLLTGIAGLVAGAFSMALGEWVSVTSARELAEREVAAEEDELAVTPEDEREELQLIYEAKGLSRAEADQLSRELLARPRTALEVLTREELGIDPGRARGFALDGRRDVVRAVRDRRSHPRPATGVRQRLDRGCRQCRRQRAGAVRHRGGDHRPHGSLGLANRAAAADARTIGRGEHLRHRPAGRRCGWLMEGQEALDSRETLMQEHGGPDRDRGV
jgi:vacuolar iron transporter family protein